MEWPDNICRKCPPASMLQNYHQQGDGQNQLLEQKMIEEDDKKNDHDK